MTGGFGPLAALVLLALDAIGLSVASRARTAASISEARTIRIGGEAWVASVFKSFQGWELPSAFTMASCPSLLMRFVAQSCNAFLGHSMLLQHRLQEQLIRMQGMVTSKALQGKWNPPLISLGRCDCLWGLIASGSSKEPVDGLKTTVCSELGGQYECREA